MPTTVDIREALKAAYLNRAWAIKVNRMSDAQALAIYKRLREQKKI